MPENIDQFKENVKNSFQKAKEDIKELHSKIEDLKQLIIKLNASQEALLKNKTENTLPSPPAPQIQPDLPEKNVSTGSKGVYSFTHSINSYSINMHSDVKQLLSRLTKQEFLTFLTIYQLEEEKGPITYTDISLKIGLSEGCVRTYISALIKKKAPINKQKYNNKTIYLSILKEFRELNLKQLLIDTYYRNDPAQKRLHEL